MARYAQTTTESCALLASMFKICLWVHTMFCVHAVQDLRVTYKLSIFPRRSSCYNSLTKQSLKTKTQLS